MFVVSRMCLARGKIRVTLGINVHKPNSSLLEYVVCGYEYVCVCGHIEMKYAKHNLLSSDDVLILIWQPLTAGQIRMCAHTDSSINSANVNIDG